ncbi:DUF6517 family protein [Natronoglomus mannanivorans]|uniref:DUF6517 family protein n=1 Tax=Natronoglomus mannanivorans TaxID=2979990 RepID=A0AAP2YY84_9EURY|nr:DUF6517 family protein [Halobacteria archaeon AArc-xg1-1]
MTTRRAVLAAGATGALALSSGCLGFVTGSEALEFDASKVLPADAALEETGYEHHDSGWERIEETVSVGVEREIHASLWNAVYSKEVSIQGQRQEAAMFAAVSVPAMEIAGSTQNPLDDMDNREILDEVRDQIEGNYGSLRDIRHHERTVVSILGADRSVDVFAARTDLEGEEMELRLPLTTFTHEDDLLVLVGGYPRLLPDEGVNIEVLMESIEHPLE